MDLKYIKVKNFRNYSNDELSLSDSSFWILRGKNSAGKSTLACDAITYSLFGQIKAMKDFQDQRLSVDDIIKRGNRKAVVTIEFGHKGDNYKISRSREIRGKSAGKELVNLWKNGKEILSNATKTTAKNWISENLWTYEDFTNTTLILQDEMTKALEMSISKRKDYIETIFGIKKFVEMSALSHEMAKQITRDIDTDLLKLQNEGSIEDKIKFKEVEIPAAQDSLESKIKLHLKITQQRDEQKKQVEELQTLLITYNSIKNEIETTTKSIEGRKGIITGIQTKLDEVQKIVENKSNVETQVKKVEDIKRKIESFTTTRRNQERLQKQIGLLQETIENEKSRITQKIADYASDLESQNGQLQSKMNEMETINKRAEEIPTLEIEISKEKDIVTQISELEKQQKIYTDLDKKLAEKQSELSTKLNEERKRIKELTEKVNSLEDVKDKLTEAEQAQTEEESLINQIKALNAKKEKLNGVLNITITSQKLATQDIERHTRDISTIQDEIQTFSSLHDQAICPTCKQNLNQNHIDLIIQDSKNKVEQLESKREKLREGIKNSEQLLAKQKVELSDLQKDIETKSQEKDTIHAKVLSLNQLRKELELLVDKAKELKIYESQGGSEAAFPELRTEVQNLQNSLGMAFFDQEKLNQARNALTAVSTKKERLNNIKESVKSKESLQTNIDELVRRVTDLTGLMNKLQKDLDRENFAMKERENFAQFRKELAEVNLELKDEEQLQIQLKQLNPEEVSNQLKKIADAEKQLIRLNTDYRHQNEEISKENTKLRNSEQKLNDSKFISLQDRVKETSEKLAEIEAELTKSLEEKIALEHDIKQLKIDLKSLKNEIKEIETVKEKIQEESDKKDDYELLEHIFKQIGGRILARLRNQINLETINIFNMLGNPQLQGISLKEDFSIAIQTPDGEEVPSFFSGGQKIRIGFALRLALSKVLAEYRGNEVETLIIDEGGFGALDQDGQDGVVEVFTAMQDRFRRVLIISHINNIAQRLPGIQVNIENGRIIEKTVYSPAMI